MTFQSECRAWLRARPACPRKNGGRADLGRTECSWDVSARRCSVWPGFCLSASMFDEPLHPKLVHVPLGLAVVLPLILLVLLVTIRRDLLAARCWWLGVGLAALLAASAGLAVRTGDADSDRVEAVVPESFVDEHEEAGERMLVSAIVAAAIAAAGGLVRDRSARVATQAAAVLSTLVTLVLGIRAGGLGGALVYKHGAAAVYAPGPATSGPVKSTPRPKNVDED